MQLHALMPMLPEPGMLIPWLVAGVVGLNVAQLVTRLPG